MIKNALHTAEIDRLDAELLLCHVLRKDRTWLMAHPDTPLSPLQKGKFDELVERRKKNEPLAYLIGEKEFYGRDFSVDKRVLIPRPSTETLIDEVKKYFAGEMQSGIRSVKADTGIVIFFHIKNYLLPPSDRARAGTTYYPLIIDIGTGSGCIGITLALEIPNIEVLCTDISTDALEVAKENAERHGVLDRVSFVEADCIPCEMLRYAQLRHPECSKLAARARSVSRDERSCTTRPTASGRAQHDVLNEPYLLVSNPPYIPVGEKLPIDISAYEPHEALYAGADGMDILRELSRQCEDSELCCGSVFECRDEQGKELAAA